MSLYIARVLFGLSLLACVWSLQLSAHGDMTEPREINTVVEALPNYNYAVKTHPDSSCRYLATKSKTEEDSETFRQIFSAGLGKRLDNDSGYGSSCEVRKMNKKPLEDISAGTSKNRLSMTPSKKLVRVARPECPLLEPFSPGSKAIHTEFDSGKPMLELENEARSDTNSETEPGELKDVSSEDPTTIEVQQLKDNESHENISGGPLEETKGAELKEDACLEHQNFQVDISSKAGNSLEDVNFETPMSSLALLRGGKSIYGKLRSLFGSKKTKTNRESRPEKDIITDIDSVVNSEPSEGFFLEIGHAGWTSAEPSLVGPHPRGVDSYFYSMSEDGTTFLFGVFDALNSLDVNANQEFFSTGMRDAAKDALEDSREEKPLTPLEVTQIAYEKAILDLNVPAGSTATLMGTIDAARKLQLSYTGTPWACLFRGKELLDQTRLRSDAESGVYHFVKTPLEVYQSPSMVDIRAKQVFATMEQDTWGLQKGDIVLVTTNGLYKRLSSNEIQEHIDHCLEKGRGMRFLATNLVKSAIEKNDSMKPDDGESNSANKNDVTEDIVVLVMRVV
ncbi:Serine/threonine protein phosphatase PrpC [Metschnikowia aff. pulcherrima]|uniref:Serine/threonine protein phosphatase PrpC n=1 Tax=Metschnikowia aff. pulcherrima TaxID=2163413 RepID=A0A4P6XJB7_9ASCO|nr:Serine/threonine protein phosphatase PrpC [Metschnikowia aff. pulcherrima]